MELEGRSEELKCESGFFQFYASCFSWIAMLELDIFDMKWIVKGLHCNLLSLARTTKHILTKGKLNDIQKVSAWWRILNNRWRSFLFTKKMSVVRYIVIRWSLEIIVNWSPIECDDLLEYLLIFTRLDSIIFPNINFVNQNNSIKFEVSAVTALPEKSRNSWRPNSHIVVHFHTNMIAKYFL